MKLPENTQNSYFSELQPRFVASSQQPTTLLNIWLFLAVFSFYMQSITGKYN